MTGRAPGAVVIPARPAMLDLGGRRIPIDEWPLARSAEERRSVEIAATEDGQLVIAPGRGVGPRLVAQALLALALGTMPALVGATVELPAWVTAAMSAAVLVVMILFLRGQFARRRRFRFDRPSGRLVVDRRAGFRPEWRAERELPLASILAVQLLFHGRHTVAEPQGAGDHQTISYREFAGYELNLVLDGDRLHLLALADWAWLREAGGEVAAYLGVPVVDRLDHGG